MAKAKIDPTRRLTKEDIWAADDIVEQDVSVPQWGGTVRVRSLSLLQAAECNKHASVRDPRTGKEDQDQSLLLAGLLCEGLIDPEYTFDECKRLLRKSSAAVTLIVKAINDLSGLTEIAVSEADKSDGSRPAPTVPVFPGPRIEDDARRTVAADVEQ